MGLGLSDPAPLRWMQQEPWLESAINFPFCELHCLRSLLSSRSGIRTLGITTRLSDFTFTFHFHALETEMATHPSVLAWRIPGTGGAWWAAVFGVAQSWTWLEWLSRSSSDIWSTRRIHPITALKMETAKKKKKMEAAK